MTTSLAVALGGLRLPWGLAVALESVVHSTLAAAWPLATLALLPWLIMLE